MSALLWKFLLAATLPTDADLSALSYPLYASPKIDGFRVGVQRGQAVSRNGVVYRNSVVQELFGRHEFEGIDGELCVGPPYASDVFNRTQNVVNSGKPAAAEEFRKHGAMWVIDRVIDGASFAERQKALYEDGALAGNASQGYVQIIQQTAVRNAKQLATFEEKCLKRGYEGVMLRRGDAGVYSQKPGKENRSTLREFELVKMKRMDHGFAFIADAYALRHNANDEKTGAGKRSTKKIGIVIDTARVGSVLLSDHTKYEFTVNVQTDELRNKGMKWWKSQIGKRVRYTFQNVGVKDAPRFPQCTFTELL
jgi:DNA ligase-1